MQSAERHVHMQQHMPSSRSSCSRSPSTQTACKPCGESGRAESLQDSNRRHSWHHTRTSHATCQPEQALQHQWNGYDKDSLQHTDTAPLATLTICVPDQLPLPSLSIPLSHNVVTSLSSFGCWRLCSRCAGVCCLLGRNRLDQCGAQQLHDV